MIQILLFICPFILLVGCRKNCIFLVHTVFSVLHFEGYIEIVESAVRIPWIPELKRSRIIRNEREKQILQSVRISFVYIMMNYWWRDWRNLLTVVKLFSIWKWMALNVNVFIEVVYSDWIAFLSPTFVTECFDSQ